jgi:hypothetical protein
MARSKKTPDKVRPFRRIDVYGIDRQITRPTTQETAMKHPWIPALVLCGACSSAPSTSKGEESGPQGPACCEPGCCDEDPSCCPTRSAVGAITFAPAARTEPSPCCTPGVDCCATPGASTR